MRVVMLGAPGTGKGTMAISLADAFDAVHISTGDLFRTNIRNQTPLGQLAERYINQGALVPDATTIGMMEQRIQEPDCAAGYFFDGFPRTRQQAEALDKMLAQQHVKLDAVINLVVNEEEIVHRIVTRRVCSSCGKPYNTEDNMPKDPEVCDVCGGAVIQRADDTEETVRKRLEAYHAETEPLIDYYEKQGILITVNNEGETGGRVPLVISLLKEAAGR